MSCSFALPTELPSLRSQGPDSNRRPKDYMKYPKPSPRLNLMAEEQSHPEVAFRPFLMIEVSEHFTVGKINGPGTITSGIFTQEVTAGFTVARKNTIA